MHFTFTDIASILHAMGAGKKIKIDNITVYKSSREEFAICGEYKDNRIYTNCHDITQKVLACIKMEEYKNGA